MDVHSRVTTLLVLFNCLTITLFSQTESSLPALSVSLSPVGNGMGEISTSMIDENAIAVVSNPGMLGIQALDSHLRSSFYTSRSYRTAPFLPTEIIYNASATNVGMILHDVSSFPMRISLGIGRSAISARYRFTISSASPLPTRCEDHQDLEGISLAFGIESYVRFGIGVSFKNLESTLGLFSPGTDPRGSSAHVSTYDVGLTCGVPVSDIVARVSGKSLRLGEYLHPTFDIMSGYSRCTLGESRFSYTDSYQGDPLPRRATFGLGLKLGLSSDATTSPWEVISLSFAREADDLLLFSTTDTAYDDNGGILSISDRNYAYQNGLGDIDIVDNIIRSEGNGNVQVRRGWQLNLGELLYLRGGSFDKAEQRSSTSGFGLRLYGLFRLLEMMNNRQPFTPVLAFVARHIDIQFDHASESVESPRPGTSFNSLSFIIR